jgi:glycosyltransferase involved in cell wall biosynthesis
MENKMSVTSMPFEADARVVHVALSLDVGGTERLIIEMVKRLAPRSAAVCCLDAPGSWATVLTDLGIPVVALHRKPGFRPSLALQLAAVAARFRANVIHCHHYSPFVYGQLAALRSPKLHVVFTEHGRLSDAPPSAKRWLANQVMGRLPGAFYAVSEDLRQHLLAEGFRPDRVGVIYNGIELGTEPGPADREDARRRLGMVEEAFVIGAAGRLERVKDLGTLLEAFASVRARMPRARLVIVGGGAERLRLEQQVSALGLQRAVQFTGHRDDVRCLLPGFDVFVNSSTSEGVSLTILEAMASRLPVVATRVGGTPEVVEDGLSGVLVPARAPGQLAHAIVELASHPDRAAPMGTAGRKRVEARFSIDRMVDRYAGVYDSLTSGSGAKQPHAVSAEGY